jgi:hypothetical protein
MKKYVLSLLAVFCAAVSVNALDFSVSGTGATQTQGNSESAFGTAFRLEKFVTDSVSFGAVQGVSYASAASTVRGSTELFGAYNLNYTVFGFKNTTFAGAASGVGYGDGAAEWTAGPLLGNRFFLKDNVYLLTQANYDVGLNPAASNSVRYTIGIGIRF